LIQSSVFYDLVIMDKVENLIISELIRLHSRLKIWRPMRASNEINLYKFFYNN
jgi:hypothetical protein